MSDLDKAVLAAQVAVSVGVLSLLGVIVNSILTFEFRRKFESRLQEEKYRLEQVTKVHAVKFEKLYDKMSSIIQRTFRLVTRTYHSSIAFTSPAIDERVRETKWEAYTKDYERLQGLIRRNRIYLPSSLYETITAFLDLLRNASSEYRARTLDKEKVEGDNTHRMRAYEAFEHFIKPQYSKLCDDIQRIIGADESKK